MSGVGEDYSQTKVKEEWRNLTINGNTTPIVTMVTVNVGRETNTRLCMELSWAKLI